MIFLCSWLAPVSGTDWRQVVTGLAGSCRLAYVILSGCSAPRAAELCCLASGLQREVHVLLAGGGCVHKASVMCSLLPSVVSCCLLRGQVTHCCAQCRPEGTNKCASHLPDSLRDMPWLSPFSSVLRSLLD